uniref:SCO family protein n=1 Tax=Coralloluteibacterium stylophorae TaxID=1776034 RepID=A0A8J8AWF4_9GAMM
MRACLLVALLVLAAGARAAPDAAVLAREVGIDQNRGTRLPAALELRESDATRLRLDALFGARPVLLMFGYYLCPNLCRTDLAGLARAVQESGLEPGEDVEIAFVGIDPREGPDTAAAVQREYAAAFPEADVARWHFLTGEEDAVRALARRAGFRYLYDREIDQYAHAAGLYVVSPDRMVSSVLLGVRFDPDELAAAVEGAAREEVAAPVQQLLLLCFHYDPTTGRYSLRIVRALQVLGVATALGLLALVWRMQRRHGRRA